MVHVVHVIGWKAMESNGKHRMMGWSWIDHGLIECEQTRFDLLWPWKVESFGPRELFKLMEALFIAFASLLTLTCSRLGTLNVSPKAERQKDTKRTRFVQFASRDISWLLTFHLRNLFGLAAFFDGQWAGKRKLQFSSCYAVLCSASAK